MSEVEAVRGKRVVIRFEGRKCIHSRQCVLSRPDVFVPNVEGEWIHPDEATPEEIAALAQSTQKSPLQESPSATPTQSEAVEQVWS